MRTMVWRTMMAAVMVVGVAAWVSAQPPAGGVGQGPGGPGMRQGMGPGGRGGLGALKLTPEQRKKVQALQQNQRAANQDAVEKLRGLNEQYRAALFGDNPDQAIGIAKQVADLEAQLSPARVAMQVEIVKLLTPDQKKIAMELNLFGPAGPGMRAGRGGGSQGRR